MHGWETTLPLPSAYPMIFFSQQCFTMQQGYPFASFLLFS